MVNTAYVVDHEMHDGLGHEVPHSLVDNGHVGIHKVPDGLHLPLKLRIHGVHNTIWAVLLTSITLLRNSNTYWYSHITATNKIRDTLRNKEWNNEANSILSLDHSWFELRPQPVNQWWSLHHHLVKYNTYWYSERNMFAYDRFGREKNQSEEKLTFSLSCRCSKESTIS